MRRHTVKAKVRRCGYARHLFNLQNVGESPPRGCGVKERIVDLLNKQCAKGEAKYGHTLDDCPDDKYDWKLMAMEELIDLVQYQHKEIMRLERLLIDKHTLLDQP